MGLWRMALVFGFGLFIAVTAGEVIVSAILPNVGDHETYMAATRSWLAGDGFYPARQLGGPYTVGDTDILYPPTMLVLFVPFSLIPDVAWWLVPSGILAAVFLYWRPSLFGWTLILACLANPKTFVIFLWGNPGMWFAAAVALGTIYHWPSVLVFLKPTLAPFGLVGIRHRSWWVALAVMAVVSLAFLPMWFDWLRVTLDARGSYVTITYSWQQIPLMLSPLVARWASTRKTPTPEGAGAVVSAERAGRVGS